MYNAIFYIRQLHEWFAAEEDATQSMEELLANLARRNYGKETLESIHEEKATLVKDPESYLNEHGPSTCKQWSKLAFVVTLIIVRYQTLELYGCPVQQ